MRRRGALVALVAAACGGPSPPAGPVISEAGPRSVLVMAREPVGTSAAVALVVPGSGWEDDGTRGAMHLAARAVVEDATGALAPLGARAAVACGRWAFVVTLVAPRETWREAAGVLVSALEGAAPSAAAVERARRVLAESLARDRANPAWQGRLAAGRALYGGEAGGGAWARPACGVAEALGLFDAAEVRRAAERLRPVRSMAVVGPSDSADVAAAEALARRVPGAGAGQLPVPGPPSPGRVYVERNTVTAWVSVAWPFGPGADPEAVGLVGALLEEAVGPAVSRPEVLHASSEVEVHGAGGALVVTAVVAPEWAAGVAAALEAEATRLAGGREHPGVVEAVARRWRGARLVELEAPEARAARMAVEVARGRIGEPWPRKESFTAGAVEEAAGALGEPARAVVGPRGARAAALP